MATTAQALMTQAVGLGFDALSERDLKEAIVALATVGAGLTVNDVQTIVNTVYTQKQEQLSQRDLRLCLAGVYGNATGNTAAKAAVLAASNHYAALSDDQLDQAFLAVLA